METLKSPPMTLSVCKSPVLHYTLPRELVSGAAIKYYISTGIKLITWTGLISSVNENRILVRLQEGPFRGFTASHEFVSEGNLTACYDSMSFQGFSDRVSEEIFAKLINETNIVYAIFSRKERIDALLAYESQKQTRSFEALNSNEAAG
ncbi:MAG: hypothetical protein HUK21_01235 [Fibrobacteraceae bacterium]|nr:hypothetical protein [Fibrobacteraceae bacterium]